MAAVCMAASAMAQDNGFIAHYNDGETRWSINLFGLSASSENNHTNFDFDFGLHRDYSEYCTPGLYFGLSNMISDDINLKPGNSLEFGFTPFDFAWWNRRHNFGIIAGVGISWTRNAFKKNEGIVNLGNDTFRLVPLNGTGNSNPRMTYASWRLPIEFAYTSHDCLFTAGIEGELRHHLRMRTKYEDPVTGKVTKRHHYITMHEMGVNPFGVNAVASIGCKGMSLYGRMALTDFFNKNETNLEATPFMVGIRFYSR